MDFEKEEEVNQPMSHEEIKATIQSLREIFKDLQ